MEILSKNRFPLNKPRPKTSGQRPVDDVAKSKNIELPASVDWVGMESMQLPLKLGLGDEVFTVPAEVNCFVSLDDPNSKGIHMSRLYEILMQQAQTSVVRSAGDFRGLLIRLMQSQSGLSGSSKLEYRFALPIYRTSLKSGKKGFRSYPISLSAVMVEEDMQFHWKTEIKYSSTCPCSAALSRQLMSEHFLKSFRGKETISTQDVGLWLADEKSLVATPHAQRSVAEVELKMNSKFSLSELIGWIDKIEMVLGTPVQTAVKREDEQEFARLNASNLMFCEDAARKLKSLFDSSKDLKGYHAKVRHLESLHPHDAVAVIRG